MTTAARRSVSRPLDAPSFGGRAREACRGPLRATTLDTLQVNTGLLCNQECVHCHVESSPRRKELMERRTMEAVVRFARRAGCRLVDITGGAPELHPDFRWFVAELRAAGRAVQLRTNLTVLLLPRSRDLPAFLREHRVRLVASLPCYLEENVEKQRGAGVFQKSIDAIRLLNEAGYGVDPALGLDLMYNPVGPHLPPAQETLEEAYRRELRERYGISFSRLFTLANMPIGRFLEDLAAAGRDREYVELLVRSFNPATVDGLMCRHQISVRWDGALFDCDFNLALGLRAGVPARSIQDADADVLRGRHIETGAHCFGCTAGAGSSCGGALA